MESSSQSQQAATTTIIIIIIIISSLLLYSVFLHPFSVSIHLSGCLSCRPTNDVKALTAYFFRLVDFTVFHIKYLVNKGTKLIC